MTKVQLVKVPDMCVTFGCEGVGGFELHGNCELKTLKFDM
jgi:hypothetical protein